jgi:hypothetical protein
MLGPQVRQRRVAAARADRSPESTAKNGSQKEREDGTLGIKTFLALAWPQKDSPAQKKNAGNWACARRARRFSSDAPNAI